MKRTLPWVGDERLDMLMSFRIRKWLKNPTKSAAEAAREYITEYKYRFSAGHRLNNPRDDAPQPNQTLF